MGTSYYKKPTSYPHNLHIEKSNKDYVENIEYFRMTRELEGWIQDNIKTREDLKLDSAEIFQLFLDKLHFLEEKKNTEVERMLVNEATDKYIKRVGIPDKYWRDKGIIALYDLPDYDTLYTAYKDLGHKYKSLKGSNKALGIKCNRQRIELDRIYKAQAARKFRNLGCIRVYKTGKNTGHVEIVEEVCYGKVKGGKHLGN